MAVAGPGQQRHDPLTGHDADIPQIDAKRTAIKETFDAKYWKIHGAEPNAPFIPPKRSDEMSLPDYYKTKNDIQHNSSVFNITSRLHARV